MAEIINLRRLRKAKVRIEATVQAAENRVRFGRTKAELTRDQRAAERLARVLDQAKGERLIETAGPLIK